MTPSSRTSGQETKYRRLVEDAAKKAVDLVLDKNETDQAGWQRLLEHGDELCHSITETIVDRTRELSLSDQYANEEVESTYVYPKEYKGPRPIEEQIRAKAAGVKELLEKVEPTTTRTRPQELGWNKGWNQFNKPRG